MISKLKTAKIITKSAFNYEIEIDMYLTVKIATIDELKKSGFRVGLRWGIGEGSIQTVFNASRNVLRTRFDGSTFK